MSNSFVSEAGEHYRSFYENAVEGFYQTTVEGRYMQANLSLARIYGFSSVEELVDEAKFSARRLYVEDGRRAEFIRTMEQREFVSRFESEVFRKDGSTIWISESARVIRDDRGEILCFEGTVTDITRQKEAEIALLESRSELENRVRERTAELRANMERMDRLIENVPGMVFQIESSPEQIPVFKFVNEGVIDIYGVTPEEVLSGEKDPIAMVHPDDESSLWKSLSDAVSGIEKWQWVGRIVSETGESKRVQCQAQPQSTGDGHIIWDGVIIDITELHSTRHALRKTEKQHAAILEASSDGILTIDSQGKILRINPAAENILGALAKVIVGKNMGEIFSDVSTATAETTHGSTFSILNDPTFIGKRSELSALRSDGSSFPVELTFSPVSMEEETIFTVNMRDISGRKRFERQLKLSRDEAQRANRAKSEFLSRMSHELRTPLNAILGFSQLLLRRETDAKKSEKVEFIRRAGNHLLGLINEILDLARIESGKLCCSIEEISSVEILEEVVAFSNPLAAERNVTLTLDESATVDFRILADQQRLKQILLNLVGNAIKYNRAGGDVRLLFDPVCQNKLRIRVCDTGVGIPAGKMRDLFTPFERIGAENSDIEGTGIGLALSQSLAELMGSRIEVESTVGEGSCFSLELPLAQSDSRNSAPSSAHHAGAHCRMEHHGSIHSLLYIEDNPVNTRLMEDLVHDVGGWSLMTAKCGTEGLELARKRIPDMIFLDLHLPDMNGDKVLERLRNRPELAESTIAIITADAMNEVSERFAESGADHFLTKPINLSQIQDVLESVARERDGLVS